MTADPTQDRMAEMERELERLRGQVQTLQMWQCPTCGGPLTADGRYPDPYCRACEAVGL